MNLLECHVTKILSEPTWREHKGFRWVEVEIEYNCYGVISEGVESFKTEEAAKSLKVGDVLLR